MSYEFYCESYDAYCRRRDGTTPDDRLDTHDVEVTSESDGDVVLDDD